MVLQRCDYFVLYIVELLLFIVVVVVGETYNIYINKYICICGCHLRENCMHLPPNERPTARVAAVRPAANGRFIDFLAAVA